MNEILKIKLDSFFKTHRRFFLTVLLLQAFYLSFIYGFVSELSLELSKPELNLSLSKILVEGLDFKITKKIVFLWGISSFMMAVSLFLSHRIFNAVYLLVENTIGRLLPVSRGHGHRSYNAYDYFDVIEIMHISELVIEDNIVVLFVNYFAALTVCFYFDFNFFVLSAFYFGQSFFWLLMTNLHLEAVSNKESKLRVFLDLEKEHLWILLISFSLNSIAFYFSN